MSNYTYMSEVCDNKENNKENECIVCFEQCNDQLHIFCKKCDYKFHVHCFLNWEQMCKKKKQNHNVCLHCQNENTLFKIKKGCCYYYKKKV